jgi:hypothetical protein
MGLVVLEVGVGGRGGDLLESVRDGRVEGS